jgi:hypothetical protein
MLLIMLEMLFKPDCVVESSPCVLPSCWLALVNAPTVERMFCAME